MSLKMLKNTISLSLISVRLLQVLNHNKNHKVAFIVKPHKYEKTTITRKRILLKK